MNRNYSNNIVPPPGVHKAAGGEQRQGDGVLLRQPAAGHHAQEEVPGVRVQIQKGGVLMLSVESSIRISLHIYVIIFPNINVKRTTFHVR